jgi:hypothetical protein
MICQIKILSSPATTTRRHLKVLPPCHSVSKLLSGVDTYQTSAWPLLHHSDVPFLSIFLRSTLLAWICSVLAVKLFDGNDSRGTRGADAETMVVALESCENLLGSSVDCCVDAYGGVAMGDDDSD